MTALPRAPLARVAGMLLRGLFAALLVLRRPRPIHVRGTLFSGTLRWVGPERRSGISWIDDPPAAGETPVVARLSRSLGLPDALPDIFGLALRVTADPESPEAGAADIEFASTGRGVPLRYALLPLRRPESARFGALLPYRGRRGPVLLSATTVDGGPDAADWRLMLSFASPLGPWRPFALIRLTRAAWPGAQPRFDAGRRVLPGARVYPWVRALRQPSYDRVQRRGLSPADDASSTPEAPAQAACTVAAGAMD
ncbi:hypothetical protein [Microbacterium arborescens]|uniref:hypothetical protein n=1 Tax=Microbacterium arborescens TaxID=33883 RepID=UPI0027820C64|nr:hypothetical protein [Microbacterium arborescens]MDQ1217191.1 hypothetical protein [Microbacterium arborescens]